MCVFTLMFSLFYASLIVGCNERTHTHRLIDCVRTEDDDLSVNNEHILLDKGNRTPNAREWEKLNLCASNGHSAVAIECIHEIYYLIKNVVLAMR